MNPAANTNTLTDLLEALPALDPEIFSRKLARFEETGFASGEQAELFCRKWKDYCASLIEGKADPRLLHPLGAMFQLPCEETARGYLASHGLPALERLFREKCHVKLQELSDDWLFLAKIAVDYGSPESSGDLVSNLILTSYAPESFVWGVIFDLALEAPAWRRFLWDLCSTSPPDLFCGVCFLDFANELAALPDFQPHPFTSEIGLSRLREWLESDDPNDESYAVSSAEAIVHLPDSARGEFYQLALEHDSEEVRLVVAEDLIERDFPTACETLKGLCTNPVTTRRAVAILREIGMESEVPPEAFHPEFLALAEFCDWLRAPENFGEIADEIDCIGRERLYWPPAGEEREFYLFKYTYLADCGGDEHPSEIGVGVVGSETVSLVGHTNPGMTAREILALHCCWELIQGGSPDAPELMSLEAGERLLRRDIAEGRVHSEG